MSMFCSQTPIPNQACSNRASKQRKPRKRKVAASHRKSTVVCEKYKHPWATKIKKKLKVPEIYLWHKHWVGKQSEPRRSNTFQQILANESHRISGKKWIENVEPRPPGCHLGDWTALITPLPRSRVLEHLKYSLSAQDDSDWLSIVHRSAWFITIQLAGDWTHALLITETLWYLVVMWLSSRSCHWVEETWWNWTRLKCWSPQDINDYSGIALATCHGTFDSLMECPQNLLNCTAMACIYGHDRFIGAESKMSREARDEESWRIQWIKRWIQRIHPRTQLPAFGLGFQALKASSINDLSSWPSRPVAQKRQVLMAARKVAWSFRSSISARSIHGHLLNLGLFIRIGSNFSTSPKRTVLFPTSFRLIALRIVRRIGGSRIFSSSNKNLSLTFRNPPFFTTSPMADTNLVPNFSLWAHSVSSSTLQHSCSSGTGQRDVNLACIAHGAFTCTMFYPSHLGCALLSTVYVL